MRERNGHFLHLTARFSIKAVVKGHRVNHGVCRCDVTWTSRIENVIHD